MDPIRTTQIVSFRKSFNLYKNIIYLNIFLVEAKKQKTLANIIDVKHKVKGEINTLKDKLKLARETIAKFKAELAKVQKPPNT